MLIKPWRRTTRKRTVATAVSRLRNMPADELFAAGNSYLGLVGQASRATCRSRYTGRRPTRAWPCRQRWPFKDTTRKATTVSAT